MNEKGLVVTMAAIPFADAPYSSDKVSIGEIAVIRLLLEKGGKQVKKASWTGYLIAET